MRRMPKRNAIGTSAKQISRSSARISETVSENWSATTTSPIENSVADPAASTGQSRRRRAGVAARQRRTRSVSTVTMITSPMKDVVVSIAPARPGRSVTATGLSGQPSQLAGAGVGSRRSTSTEPTTRVTPVTTGIARSSGPRRCPVGNARTSAPNGAQIRPPPANPIANNHSLAEVFKTFKNPRNPTAARYTPVRFSGRRCSAIKPLIPNAHAMQMISATTSHDCSSCFVIASSAMEAATSTTSSATPNASASRLKRGERERRRPRGRPSR